VLVVKCYSFLFFFFFFFLILVNKPRDSPNLQLSSRTAATFPRKQGATGSTAATDPVDPTRYIHRRWGKIDTLKFHDAGCKSEKDPAKGQKHVWEGASLKPVRRRNQHLSICRTGKTMENYGVEQTGPS
jgi:hypothetical protein